MGKDDVPVNRHHLDMLQRKARAHDAYLWATKRMADHRRTITQPMGVASRQGAFVIGYNMALQDFAGFVKDAPPSE